MLAKKIFTISTITLFVACGLFFTSKPSVAATVTLKVSHQFAAGDVRATRVRQITTAVADGTVAALAALDFLREEGE